MFNLGCACAPGRSARAHARTGIVAPTPPFTGYRAARRLRRKNKNTLLLLSCAVQHCEHVVGAACSRPFYVFPPKQRISTRRFNLGPLSFFFFNVPVFVTPSFLLRPASVSQFWSLVMTCRFTPRVSHGKHLKCRLSSFDVNTFDTREVADHFDFHIIFYFFNNISFITLVNHMSVTRYLRIEYFFSTFWREKI